MASSFVESVGFGLLNDVLGAFRSDDGYAFPNRYSIEISPPTGNLGGGNTGRNSLANVFQSFMPSGINPFGAGSGTGSLQDIQLRAESVTLP